MRSFGVLVALSAIVLICAAAPAKDDAAVAVESNAEGLLAADAKTTHENESLRRARYFYYSPYGGLYGYGYNGYGGYYGGYGGYGLYGYGGYPYYGYSSYPFGGYALYG